MSSSSVATREWLLPVSVTGRVDLGRLLRELDKIDDFLNQAAIREPGTAVNMPKISRLMDEIVNENELNLLRSDDRQSLKDFLLAVKAKATIMHISFSADPTPVFTNKLVGWLRREIHPFLLLDVGLQPTIGVGSIVRTNNKIFDFSLRQRLISSREILMQKLHDELSEPQQQNTETSDEAAQTSQSPAEANPEESQPDQAETQPNEQIQQNPGTVAAAEPQSSEPTQADAAQPERAAPQPEVAAEQPGSEALPATQELNPAEPVTAQPEAQPKASTEQTLSAANTQVSSVEQAEEPVETKK